MIIVAGGIGKRMKTEIPKQFIPVNGRPVLMHTFEKFRSFSEALNFYLVLPEFHFDDWQALQRKYAFKIPHELVKGGGERFFSVKNALEQIPHEDGLVAIHDGVRPLVDTAVIKTAFETAGKKGNAIPAVMPGQSLRQLGEKGGSRAVDRSKFRMIQTPQVFRLKEIKKAYAQEYKSHYTDDATVLESFGKEIHLIEGNAENIKITQPGDLKIAEALLAD